MKISHARRRGATSHENVKVAGARVFAVTRRGDVIGQRTIAARGTAVPRSAPTLRRDFQERCNGGILMENHPWSWGMNNRILLCLVLICIPIQTWSEVEFPGPKPGPMHITSDGQNLVVGNNTISAGWSVGRRGFRSAFVRDEQTQQSIGLNGEVFQITLANGTRYLASEMKPVGKWTESRLAPDGHAACMADRIAAEIVELRLRSADGRLAVLWRVIGRDGSNYLRQEIEVLAVEMDLKVREITWFDEPVPLAETLGKVDGSPVIAGNFFLGYEDPMALNSVLGPGAGRRVVCHMQRDALLRKGQRLTQSFVVGVAPTGQRRRAFLYYLERERAHPYRTFLHYNAWFDICWQGVPLNEPMCLEAVRDFGENLIKPYGVVMDSMVIDDGWDNPETLWQFNSGFPNGFAALNDLCRSYSSRVGVWLSPFGGYGNSKELRLKYGREQGFEINAAGLALAGPLYYGRFKAECLNMIHRYGVNYFKFDGIASGMYANGAGGEFILDTEAMRQLMLELREETPDLFINLTTGSWPSPFWLRYADSLWRQGEDTAFTGKGTAQQRWITYRDQETYQNIVIKGPLYPLNSLMTCGVCYSRHGDPANPGFNSKGLREDIRSFFASGTHLQELYIMPGRMESQDWKTLAEAARWSRANAAVLVDTHWIGGNPGKSEVYGWASWTPLKGILTLRNPDDRNQVYSLELRNALELPEDAPKKYALKSPWAEDALKPVLKAEVGAPVAISMQPFEILTLEATPTR